MGRATGNLVWTIISTALLALFTVVVPIVFKAVATVEIEEFWNGSVQPYLVAHGWRWVTAMFEYIPTFWGGVAATLLILLAVDRTRYWLGHHSKNGATDAEDVGSEALANRVDALSDKLAELYADGQAEHDAFNQQWMNDQTHEGEIRRPVSSDGYANIELKYSKKFNQKYLREFWGIVGAAQKFTAMEFREVWQLQHGVNSLRQIHEAIIFLGKISADLRHYGRPDIPFKDTFLKVREGE